LTTPYRTKDEDLLTLWSKVRNLDDDLTEHIVHNRYASNLNASVFQKQSEDEIILCLNYDGLYGINNINRFLQKNNPNKEYIWGLWTYKVGDLILFNESERFVPVLYNNLKGRIVDIEEDLENEKIWFSIELDKALTELDVQNFDIELLDERTPGKSIIKFYARKKQEGNDENEFADDTDIPFQIAYAVSIHKAQGLEYESVKVIITQEVDEQITHNIFYTAITRSKKKLKIYWSPETQEKVIKSFLISDKKNDATIFAAQTGLKMFKR
jgi:ATP-dependent exoDNAse (exonuclease V) alpha subunit